MFQVLRRVFARLKQAPRGRRQLGWLAVVIACLLLYGTTGFYLFEREAWAKDTEVTLGTGLWWSVVTMTTVGYGDLYPRTFIGRWFVGVPMMILGIGVLGYALGTLATAVLDRRNKEARGMLPFTGSNHVLVCHFPSLEMVLEIAQEVRADSAWKDKQIVLLSEQLEELPEALGSAGVTFVRGSPSREAALESANVAGASGVIVLSRDPADPNADNHTLACVVTIRAIAPGAYVVAECLANENEKLLRNAGASEVVRVDSLSAELLVQGLQDPGVTGVISELLTNRTGHQLYIHPVTSFRGDLAGAQAKLAPGRYACLGVIDASGARRFVPDPSTPVEPGHKLMLVGDTRPAPL
ncbi:MAG: ion channel [Planctomycetota bacterium]